MRLVKHFIAFFATSLINSIIQEQELLKNHIFGMKRSRFCHLHNVIHLVLQIKMNKYHVN